MFYRIRNKLNYYSVNQLIKPLIKSAWAELDSNAQLIIVTQLCARDLYLYLVAIITFTRKVRPQKIIVINDGSLKIDHLKLLKEHINNLEVVELQDIDTGRCPKGGTWERLVLCCQLSKDTYVVQLDADTLTIGSISEVLAAICNKQTFILGTYQCTELQTLESASQFALKIQSQSIQIMAEKCLVKLGDNFPNLYIRGCSGFAGFNSKIPSIDLLEEFSSKMASMLGGSWNTWGSEQFASNYLLSNSLPMILTEPKYENFSYRTDISKAEFIHFIGNNRFHNGTLKKLIVDCFKK